MASTIEKDLSKERKTSVEETKTKSESVKLLMEGNAIEERNILKEAGLDFNLKKVEKQVGVNIERSKREEQIGSKVFTIQEIEKTCVRYALRFLPSQNYKGTIEPTLGATILEFFRSKGIDGRSHEARYNLYIMAPSKAFNLEERPDPPPVDPVMFYKMSTSEGDMYALVHKWGKDFTIARRLIGAVRETSVHWFWFKIVSFFVLYSIATATIGWAPLFLLGMLVNISLSFLTVLGWSMFAIGSDRRMEKYRNRFSRRNWNSIYTD